MTNMRIVEICTQVTYGDGVGNDILGKAELFRELGYSCEVYAETIDPRLKGQVQPFSRLQIRCDDIVLHHYASYTNLVEVISQFPCVRVLMYHNVTPPELVSPDMRQGCEESLAQVRKMAGKYDYYAGVSGFNLERLCEMGVTAKGDVLPILVEFDRSKVCRAEKKPGDPVNFLFVGRVVHSKMQHEIIEIFNFYFCNFNQNAELYLAGDTGASASYFEALKKQVNGLPSKTHIHFTGKISNEKLVELYNQADVFLSMSRHEGFGIPLLEAMNFQIPVFAYDAAAVKDTLGGAGILLETNNPAQIAGQINEVLCDSEGCRKLLADQTARLADFSRAAVKKNIVQLVEKWSHPQLDTPEGQAIYQRLLTAQITAKLQQQAEAAACKASLPPMPAVDIGRDGKIESQLAIMEANRENYAFRHLYSYRKVIGGLIVFCKRVVRKCLKWYLEPVCFQQTEFNNAATEATQQLFHYLHEGRGQQEARNEAVSQQMQEQQQTLVAVQERAEATEKNISCVQGALFGIHKDFSNMSGALSSVRGDVSDAREEMSAMREKLNGIQKCFSNVCSDISNMRGEVSSVKQMLSDSQEDYLRQITELKAQLEYTCSRSAEIERKMEALDALKLGLFQERPDLYWERDKTSQSGEDAIINFVFDMLHIPITDVTYLDLGANHAKHLSNTNFFYQNGAHGVLVEANPELIPELKFYRPGDVILNRCVAPESGGKVKFYLVNGDGLSSPDLGSVEECLRRNPDLKIEKIVEVETISVGEILEQYFDAPPAFVNVDIEGSEMEILRSIDFEKYRPIAFSIEMIPYRPDTVVVGEKSEEILDFMISKNYVEYAFTGINSIFLDKRRIAKGQIVNKRGMCNETQ